MNFLFVAHSPANAFHGQIQHQIQPNHAKRLYKEAQIKTQDNISSQWQSKTALKTFHTPLRKDGQNPGMKLKLQDTSTYALSSLDTHSLIKSFKR